MNKVYKNIYSYVLKNYRRNLSNLDRDLDSPTCGSFDRNFWHYKTTDFNSDILQQSIHTIDKLISKDIENDFEYKILKKYLEKNIFFIFKGYKKKYFNEYYPFENGYPPHAFIADTLGDIFSRYPEFLKNRYHRKLYFEIILDLSKKKELNASNQFSKSVSAIFKYVNLFPDSKCHFDLDNLIKDLLKMQDYNEGWFNEYGGFDTGYLSVTLESLADIFFISKNENIKKSIDVVLDFYLGLMDKSGFFPSTCNSRNTEYILPYGFARVAEINSKSNIILTKVFGEMNHEHFLWAVDDRYNCHYIFTSLLKSLKYLTKLNLDKSVENKKNNIRNIYYPNAGIIKKNFHNKTIYISTKKGGIIRVHHNDSKKINFQNGYRLFDNKKIFTSNFQGNSKLDFSKKKNVYQITGNFVKVAFLVPSSFKHLVLRFFSFFLKNNIIKFLKNKFIFKTIDKNYKFSRKIIILESNNLIKVEDIIINAKNLEIRVNPKQNLRYVASADSFSNEDFSGSIDLFDKKIISKSKHKINFNIL